MFEKLYSMGLERELGWSELAYMHRCARARPESYFEFLKILPLRGNPVDPEVIHRLTQPSLTYRDDMHKAFSDSWGRVTTLRAENGWRQTPICKDEIYEAMTAARLWITRLGGTPKYQYSNLLQRGLAARPHLTIGGIPHTDRSVERIAREGELSVFANMIDPALAAKVGRDISDYGMRIMRLDGVSYERFEKIDEMVLNRKSHFQFGRELLRQNFKPGWHVLQPNHWHILSVAVPHFAGTVHVPRRRMVGMRKARMATLDIENFFEPLEMFGPPDPAETARRHRIEMEMLDL